jgi:hypothetical protein
VINGKTIPLLSYSVGASNPATISVGGGAGTDKVSYSSLSLIKVPDAISAALFTAVANLFGSGTGVAADSTLRPSHSGRAAMHSSERERL